MNPTARRNARRYALQAMYQWQLSGTKVQEIEDQFIAEHIDQQIDLDYFKELIRGIVQQQPQLDQQITPYLKRVLNELDPVELAILRLCTYELTNRLDIPYRVVLNEGLELTKRFGSAEGYKFINGVLDQVARKLRPVESEGRQTK